MTPEISTHKFVSWHMWTTTRTRLAAIEDRLRALEHELKNQRLELETTYEKTLRLHRRLTKRLYDAERAEQDSDPIEGSPPMDPVTQRILARRGKHHVRSIGSARQG